MGTKRRASKHQKRSGEKFSHKERDLSGISAHGATDFFSRAEIYNLTPHDAQMRPL
jgi:hypothetical protein